MFLYRCFIVMMPSIIVAIGLVTLSLADPKSKFDKDFEEVVEICEKDK